LESNISSLNGLQRIAVDSVGFFQREPLQDCEKRIDGRNKNSQGSASSSYIGMVLRLSQPFEYRFKFDWIWLPFGIAGLVYLVYGVVVFIVSFGNEGSGVMLFKGIGYLAGGWIAPVFCLFHWVYQQ
jgi:hypothetical protein